MIKIIDLPDKIFFVCAILLREMFLKDGHEVIFWVRDGAERSDWYFSYDINTVYPAFAFGAEDQRFEDLITGQDVEFVTWHHAHSYRPVLEKCLNVIGRLSSSCEISFYPDGIANYAKPRPIDESIFENNLENWSFGTFYNFGISGFTVPDDFCSGELASRPVPVVEIKSSLSEICNRYSHRSDPFWDGVRTKMASTNTNRLCFLIMRSWCSTGYNDRYNFGNGVESLSDIYTDLLAYHREKIGDSVYIIRDDSRTRKNHPTLVKRITQKNPSTDIIVCPEKYPKFLNFEFLLASMPDDLFEKVELDMMVLDSLSGFFLPFLAKRGSVYWGARNTVLKDHGASAEQIGAIGNNVKARIRNTERVWLSASDATSRGKLHIDRSDTGLREMKYSGF